MEGVKKKRFFVKTYGCQMNFHDSGLIEDGLLKNGFSKAISPDSADIVILNTCSVRDRAEHKIASAVGRLNKNTKIVLAGCFAKHIKLKKENKIDDSSTNIPIDYCFAPDEILSIPDVLANDLKKDHARNINDKKIEPVTTDNYQNFHLVEDYFYNKSVNSDTATIKIIEGCNNFCSYCIVPFVRGRERSIPLDIICNTAQIYANKGISEILLLGQNVNSYLSPESDNSKKNFSYMLETLTKIDGIKKIKFLTSHPKDFNDELIELICKNEKVSKSIHLPVQSGSDKILSAMNRGYTRRDYLRLIEKLRKGYPDIVFSTDIIVGFPTENEEDIDMTLSLLDEVKFDFIFGFKYSPRPFTKSFKIQDDVVSEKKKERLEKVFKKQRGIFGSILNELKDTQVNVTISKIDEEKNSSEFKKGIRFKGEGLNERTIYIINKNEYTNLIIGDKRRVVITYVENNRLYGEVLIK